MLARIAGSTFSGSESESVAGGVDASDISES
jgi:hypothetical protein